MSTYGLIWSIQVGPLRGLLRTQIIPGRSPFLVSNSSLAALNVLTDHRNARLWLVGSEQWLYLRRAGKSVFLFEPFNFEDGGLSRGPDVSDPQFEAKQTVVPVTVPDAKLDAASSLLVNPVKDEPEPSCPNFTGPLPGGVDSLRTFVEAQTSQVVAGAVEVPSLGVEQSPMRAAQSAVRRLCRSTHSLWLAPGDFVLCGQILKSFTLPAVFSEYIIKGVRSGHRPRIFHRFLRKNGDGATHVISILRTSTGRFILGHEPCEITDQFGKDEIFIESECDRPMLLTTIYVRIGRRGTTHSTDVPHITDPEIPVTIGADAWLNQGPYLVRIIRTPRRRLFVPSEAEGYIGPQRLRPLRIIDFYNLNGTNHVISAYSVRDNWFGRGSRGKDYVVRDHDHLWIGHVFFQRTRSICDASSSSSNTELKKVWSLLLITRYHRNH